MFVRKTPLSPDRLLTIGAVLAIAGCGADDPASINPISSVASVQLSVGQLTLKSLGEFSQLTATVRDDQGRVLGHVSPSWSSSDDAVVTVSSTGLVTAVGNGVAEVVASVGGVRAIASVTVQQVVTQIDIEPSAATLHAVGVEFRFTATAVDSMGHAVEGAGINWSSSDPKIAVMGVDGVVRTVSDGTVSIEASVEELTQAATLEVVTVAYERLDPFLTTPAEEAEWEMPVLILQYIPTADGLTADPVRAPELLGESLASINERVRRYTNRIKWAWEEGTRYHGYKDPTARPALGYRVVDHITVYEHLPKGIPWRMSSRGSQIYAPNWVEIFERFDVQRYVEQEGVKEIWFWHAGFSDECPCYDADIHDPDDFRYSPESNMASPVTGDVSNSLNHPNDLPVYSTDYVVYNFFPRSTQAAALHKRGHQLEVMFPTADLKRHGTRDLWWTFKGQVSWQGGGEYRLGRAGWTHMPPNTTTHYDVFNETLVESDIEDWSPDESGHKTLVNVDTWANLSYSWGGDTPGDWIDRTESQWYLYWEQNIPGLGHDISYNGVPLRNWWSLVANWDEIMSGVGGLEMPLSAEATGR